MKRNSRPALPIICLACAALWLAADPAGLGRGITRLLSVTVRPVAGRASGAHDVAARTLVDIGTSGSTPYRIFRLKDPSRLVVDLNSARFTQGSRKVAGRPPFVSGVRMAQFREAAPPVARVVVDLVGDPVLQVHRKTNGLLLELQPGKEWMTAPVARPAATLERTEPALGSVPQPIFRAEHWVPTQKSPSWPLSDLLSKVASAAWPQGDGVSRPALIPDPAGRAARAYETVAQDQGRAAIPGSLTVVPTGQAEPSAARSPSRYTGQPISVNLKDVDLKDFFRLIHQISGLNIIVDPNVSGTLTLVLDDVPWDQALDIVLKNNGLGDSLEGNVLRIAKTDTLAAEEESQVKLVEAQEDSAPLVSVVRYLKYARAIDTPPVNAGFTFTLSSSQPIPGVATILKNLQAALFSKRGTVTADARDNAVIITDIPKQIPIIEAVIDKLDRRVKQVSIESKIILATNDFTRSLQTALATGLNNRSGSITSNGVTGIGAGATPGVIPKATAVAGFGTYTLSNRGALYFINAAIAAAESRNQAKTLSAPNIVTQDNIQGEVAQGTTIFIQTVINNTPTSVPYSATLTLDVTPQVTEEGSIFLIIKVQNNSPGALLAGTLNPEVNTQSATTSVLVPDGGTVVFGGIKVTSNTNSYQQVPGLGRIPVLGNLFKSTNREDQVNQLLFIVSPKVLPN